MENRYKPIKGFENYYVINENGLVKSVERKILNKKGVIMNFPSKEKKHQIDKDGYEYVSLCKNGKNYGKRVHRLVAEAFIPNPDNLPVVNHKNEIKNDNRIENLEWCTVSYNNNYGNKTINTRKKVNQYDMQGNFIKTWDCIIQVADFLGVSRSNITEVCKGRQKSCKGYIWRYYE